MESDHGDFVRREGIWEGLTGRHSLNRGKQDKESYHAKIWGQYLQHRVDRKDKELGIVPGTGRRPLWRVI